MRRIDDRTEGLEVHKESKPLMFTVTATQPTPEHVGGPTDEWLEASEAAESLEDALAIVRQWVEAGEVEPYGHGKVTFHITVAPTTDNTVDDPMLGHALTD